MSHIRPMIARSPHEPHRAATPLELLFDLVAVIAIAVAAHGLRHAIGHEHVIDGLISFCFAFLAIWWPWNQFTWFASSFDNDDVIYRMKVMLLMFGAMFVAASMPAFFEGGTMVYAFAGYIIMRIAQILLWLRVTRHNPEYKSTAKRYMCGLILVQIYWAGVVFGITPEGNLFRSLFALGFALELFIPWFAERKSTTPWHPHHLLERFGLLVIIVLGEVLLSSVEALRMGVQGGFEANHLIVAVCGIIITFSLWWYYFYEPEHIEQFSFKRAFELGYGHMLIFASAAAVGAGLGIILDGVETTSKVTHHALLSVTDVQSDVLPAVHAFDVVRAGHLTVSVSIAIFIATLWLVRDRHQCNTGSSYFLLFFAAIIALSGLLPYALIVMTALLICCTGFRIAQIDQGQQGGKAE